MDQVGSPPSVPEDPEQADSGAPRRADSLARRNSPTDEDRWRTTLEALPQMVWSMLPDGSDEYYNRRWADFTGIDLQATRTSRIDLVHPDDREDAFRVWRSSLATGAPYETQYRLRHVSGSYRWVLSRGAAQRDSSGQIVRWYGACTDIHEQVEMQQALSRSEALNRSMIQATPDCVGLVDAKGRIQFLNPAAVEAMPVPNPDALLGEDWVAQFPPDARPLAARALKTAGRGEIGHFTTSLHDGGATRTWDVIVAPVAEAQGNPDQKVIIARDISHQKSLEEETRWNASHDSLTRLPNRAMFQQKLETLLAERAGFAVMLLDLDRLKLTNDTMGHDAGDALLCRVAERLSACLRKEDFIARIGGDEFGVLLSGVAMPDDVAAVAETLLTQLREPQVHRGKLLDCRCSIGASLFPAHGTSEATLIKQADIALYLAKAEGRDLFRLFNSKMRDHMQSRLSMLRVARDALDHDRIAPHYQPKIDLATGCLSGFEALMRWRHPRLGLQPPEHISVAFDDARLAVPLADAMLGKVLKDIGDWLRRDIPFHHVAINAAPAEFAHGDYAVRLLDRLAIAGIAPSHIQVEITETVFLGQADSVIGATLETLASAGVAIALDDFGTGYASLMHLKRFPIDTIKIDRSFVQNIGRSPEDEAIIEAVVGLGRSLGITVVAEGVETAAQAELLKRRNCSQGQGFLFGKPVPEDKVAEVAASYLPATASASSR